MHPDGPVRLCCMERHWTVACADGLVMCELCYERFPQDELWVDVMGQKWDTCQTCGEYNDYVRRLLLLGYSRDEVVEKMRERL